LDRKIKASPKVNKPPWRLQIGTFRKLLIMTCSRRLKVWLVSLLATEGMPTMQVKNTLVVMECQAENCQNCLWKIAFARAFEMV
jgi:hypothetical protein